MDIGWIDEMTGCYGECDIDNSQVTFSNFALNECKTPPIMMLWNDWSKEICIHIKIVQVNLSYCSLKSHFFNFRIDQNQMLIVINVCTLEVLLKLVTNDWD